MRSFIPLIALLPVVFGCDNPDTDACAAIFTASSAAAKTFCLTYTEAAHTATTGLPAPFAAPCANKPSKLSSACSCLVPGTLTSAPAPVTTAKTTAVTPAPTGSACTVTNASGISSAVASCTNIVLSNIAMPAGQTLDLTKLKSGTTVTFAGTTTFGTTADDDFNPIEIKGTNVHITGASGHVIDGNGPAYWDGQGSNGGSSKPDHFIVLDDMTSSSVTNLNIRNWPVHCFDITGGTDLTLSGLTLDNSAGDAPNSKSGGDAAAHNSDGFDISSTNGLTLSNTVVKNQDDCVAVTSGTDITVTGMTCSGGHGLSIGSIGGKSNNVVNGVTFSDSTITNSQNGARIKTNSGTTGTVSNIIYQNIKLSGITTYGIDIQQDYLNGGPTGVPTNGVKISGVQFIDVTGTVTSSAQDYFVLCGSGSCSGVTFSGVSITGGGKASSCNFPSTGCP